MKHNDLVHENLFFWKFAKISNWLKTMETKKKYIYIYIFDDELIFLFILFFFIIIIIILLCSYNVVVFLLKFIKPFFFELGNHVVISY